MSDARCATCKWWRIDDTEPSRYPYYRPDAIYHLANIRRYEYVPDDEKRRAVEPLPFRFCTRVKTLDELPDPGSAVALDGENYWSALVTHADFGCVNHEPAEE